MRTKYSGAERLILDRRVENRAMLDVYLGVIEQRFVAVAREEPASPEAVDALLLKAEQAATQARALAEAAASLRAGVRNAALAHDAAQAVLVQTEAALAAADAADATARDALTQEHAAAQAEAARLREAAARAVRDAETPHAQAALAEADRRAAAALDTERAAMEAWQAARRAAAGGLDVVAAIIARYRLSKQDAEANPHSTPVPELPGWSEAYMAEKILVRHADIATVRTDLARRLEELHELDPRTHGVLQKEFSAADGAGPLELARRAPAILVAALDQIEWTNAKRMIVRQLAGLYASRVSVAFGCVLVVAVLLVLSEIFMRSHVLARDVALAPGLSGLGFAVAAGIIGASFSAMTRQTAVSGLTRIEDVRTAVSWAMIRLRVGVGLGAAVIVYFAFDASLIAGDLFPNLDRMGFSRVAPAADAVTAGGATAQNLAAAVGDLRQVIETLSVTLAAAGPVSGPMPAEAAAATAAALDRLKAIETPIIATSLSQTLASHPLGVWVPNADLCKLVIWCFLAGFAEKFVPDLLAKAQGKAQAAP